MASKAALVAAIAAYGSCRRQQGARRVAGTCAQAMSECFTARCKTPELFPPACVMHPSAEHYPAAPPARQASKDAQDRQGYPGGTDGAIGNQVGNTRSRRASESTERHRTHIHTRAHTRTHARARAHTHTYTHTCVASTAPLASVECDEGAKHFRQQLTLRP